MTEDELEGTDTPATALDATALRHARHEANLTQAQLAERLGVRVLTVEQWEWRARPIPASLVPAIRAALAPEPQPEDADVQDEVADERPAEDPQLLEATSRQRQEAILRDTLLTAQRAASDVREQARRSATLALRKARRRARRLLAEAEQDRERAARAAAESARARRTIEAELEQLARAAREEAERVLREAEHE